MLRSHNNLLLWDLTVWLLSQYRDIEKILENLKMHKGCSILLFIFPFTHKVRIPHVIFTAA